MKNLDMAVMRPDQLHLEVLKYKPNGEYADYVRPDRARPGVCCDCKNTKLDDTGYCVNCGGETI